LALCGCSEPRRDGTWLLRWMEKPATQAVTQAARPEDRVQFVQVATFDRQRDADEFAPISDALHEGDVIAYWMGPWEARGRFSIGQFNVAGYRLFKYGHLALVVRDPADVTRLRLFSSEGFKGANTQERLNDLASHNWDVYRLDQEQRIDRARLHECVTLCCKKAGAWYGYDFAGMFGLWNSNVKPANGAQIGHDYICSTVVLAALHYSGVALDAMGRDGWLDLCTPNQVVSSRGAIVPLPDVELRAEATPSATATPAPVPPSAPSAPSAPSSPKAVP